MVNKPSSFVCYFRVSTVRQGESGLGLDGQRAAVEAFVRHHGGTIGWPAMWRSSPTSWMPVWISSPATCRSPWQRPLPFPTGLQSPWSGDGGFSMLMGELSTAVFHKRNVKILVMNNDSYGEVKFEQRNLGNPEYGCQLGHFDFAKVAEAAGASGFRAASIAELTPAMQAWLGAPGVAVLDVQVDPEEEPLEPEKLKG